MNGVASRLAILSSEEAARRLQVAPVRVRAMIRDGVLEAQKVGGRWLIGARSVERRRAQPVSEGRPYEPANAWALIDLWHDGDAKWVGKSQRSRLRRRIREQSIRGLYPALRGRAEPWRMRGHPAAIERLRENEAVRLGGVSAASAYKADIAAPDELEAYAKAEDASRLVDRFHLKHSIAPNILLHVVPGPWPFGSIEQHAPGVVPALVVALDLLESADERSRRAGEELLARLEAERESHEGVT